MAHMRNKCVACPTCKSLCEFDANLDTGKITRARMPIECGHPTKCARDYIKGIWDRQFGSKIATPDKF